MATATATSPLDVLRTRLQTDHYQTRSPHVPSGSTHLYSLLHHVRDTGRILLAIRHYEGWPGLFRGLGPSLCGVVPATAVKFYTYGNCKRLANEVMYVQSDSVVVHTISAATAGVVTSVATNPIWLIKTRLQLDKSQRNGIGGQYRNSLDCVSKVVRQEGIKGLYRGLSASFLGAAETTLHLVLYEQMKVWLAQRRHRAHNPDDWIGSSAAAGVSKFLTALVAYPHEVRTRVQLPVSW